VAQVFFVRRFTLDNRCTTAETNLMSHLHQFSYFFNVKTAFKEYFSLPNVSSPVNQLSQHTKPGASPAL
jgi:hypothetical protein